MRLKNYSLIFFSIMISGQLYCQHFRFFSGSHIDKFETVVDVVGGSNSRFEQSTYSYEFEHKLKKCKIGLIVSFQNMDGWTTFSLDDNLIEGGFAGHGASRTRLRRYGLGLATNIIDIHNFISFDLITKVEYQHTWREWDGLIITKIIDPNNGINDFFPGVVSVLVEPGSQIIPSIGARANLKLFWRFWAHMEMRWVFGHRPYQRLFFEYSYQNVPQETAEWYSDGSMFLNMLGISVKLWGPKDKRRDRIKFLF